MYYAKRVTDADYATGTVVDESVALHCTLSMLEHLESAALSSGPKTMHTFLTRAKSWVKVRFRPSGQSRVTAANEEFEPSRPRANE